MLINLKNANICQREGRLVLGNVNLHADQSKECKYLPT